MKKSKKSKGKKLFNSYQKLDDREKLIFDMNLNRYDETRKLETMSMRSSLANQLLNDLKLPDGTPYLDVNWVAKNILQLTDEEIDNNGRKVMKSKNPKERVENV